MHVCFSYILKPVNISTMSHFPVKYEQPQSFIDCQLCLVLSDAIPVADYGIARANT